VPRRRRTSDAALVSMPLTGGVDQAHRRDMRTWPAILLTVAMGCAADPSELAPTEALSAFLSALERSTHAPDQRKLAYDWLAFDSQRTLQQRARLSSSLAGRPFEPWDMLVPGRVSFASENIAAARLRAHVEGEHATVELPFERTQEREKVAMVREGGRWRVALALGP
jgi:hypothetical protein